MSIVGYMNKIIKFKSLYNEFGGGGDVLERIECSLSI